MGFEPMTLGIPSGPVRSRKALPAWAPAVSMDAGKAVPKLAHCLRRLVLRRRTKVFPRGGPADGG